MKKNLISIVILALLVVNIVLTAIMMFSVTSTNKKTAALVTDIASAISLDLSTEQAQEETAATVSMKDISPYTIADMMIPLKKSEDGSDHYVMLSVTLSMDMTHKDFKTYGADLASREDLIKGEIIEAVGQFSLETASADQQAMKDAILARIQKLFDSQFIFDVTLSSALYQ